jgi:hypothetical protein
MPKNEEDWGVVSNRKLEGGLALLPKPKVEDEAEEGVLSPNPKADLAWDWDEGGPVASRKVFLKLTVGLGGGADDGAVFVSGDSMAARSWSLAGSGRLL